MKHDHIWVSCKLLSKHTKDVRNSREAYFGSLFSSLTTVGASCKTNVGQTLVDQLLMHQCLANVGPCQHANIGMLPIAPTTPNVGPAVDCYMGITLKRRRQHCIWRAVKFLTMLITFEQKGIFIVPYLLRHKASV